VTLESGYGSDKNGVIWAYRFEPGQPGRDIDSLAVLEQNQASANGPSSAFLWIHLSLSNVASETWLRRHFAFPQSFYDSLHDDGVSTRIEQDGEALVGVVHDVLFDSSFDTSDVSTVSLYIDSKALVSVRRRPLRSIDRLRSAVKSGRQFVSPAGLLGQLLRDQADVLAEILRSSTKKVDAAEDTLLDNRISISRRELGSLRRVLVRLQRLLVPEPAALFRLLNRPPSWISADDLQDLRQAAEEFATAVTDSGALVERIKLLQEEIAALVNEQTNRTLFVLTVVTVLALPINLVAGLLGMNVGGIPLADNRHGFFLVVVLLVLATAVIAYRAFGKHRDR
jgi:zinc transporter